MKHPRERSKGDRASPRTKRASGSPAMPRGGAVRKGVLLYVGARAGEAARALGAALRRDLLRVDLSRVVGKYIGETEKNLRRVFDAAEAQNAILFFDEADALFGKRSGVTDEHDRYANVTLDDLLRRIEAYPGLAVLVTRTLRPLPSALRRRLRVHAFPPKP